MIFSISSVVSCLNLSTQYSTQSAKTLTEYLETVPLGQFSAHKNISLLGSPTLCRYSNSAPFLSITALIKCNILTTSAFFCLPPTSSSSSQLGSVFVIIFSKSIITSCSSVRRLKRVFQSTVFIREISKLRQSQGQWDQFRESLRKYQMVCQKSSQVGGLSLVRIRFVRIFISYFTASGTLTDYCYILVQTLEQKLASFRYRLKLTYTSEDRFLTSLSNKHRYSGSCLQDLMLTSLSTKSTMLSSINSQNVCRSQYIKLISISTIRHLYCTFSAVFRQFVSFLTSFNCATFKIMSLLSAQSYNLPISSSRECSVSAFSSVLAKSSNNSSQRLLRLLISKVRLQDWRSLWTVLLISTRYRSRLFESWLEGGECSGCWQAAGQPNIR